MIVTIDFETKDPYITFGYGAGWTFALRGYTNPEFKLLGASVKIDNTPTEYITDLQKIADIVIRADNLVMHNAQYDVGCLLVLFKLLSITWNYKDVYIYDTMLMAKLLNQHRQSYSLESLSVHYGMTLKDKSILNDYVWDSGLYQKWYKDHYSRNRHKKPKDGDLFQFAITNMDLIPEEIAGAYCDSDVNATYDLFVIFNEELMSDIWSNFDYQVISDNIKACVESRARGIKVDLEIAEINKKLLEQRATLLLSDVYKEIGHQFNINAPTQLVSALKVAGIKHFNKTEKGNESVRKDWLESQGNPICQKIVKIKNYQKLARDFLTKVIDYQQVHRNNGVLESRIFPNLNILGATATGRYSSSAYRAKAGQKSYELNMQQIPKRGEDEEASRYVRAIFVAEDNEQWISADYSSQEPRLQIEFAYRQECNGIDNILKQLIKDPRADIYEIVSITANIKRNFAKTIWLGLSFGMGEAKLCHSLNLPTQIVFNRWGQRREVAGTEGKEILSKYHKSLPFMKELQTNAENLLKNSGSIATIDGRILNNDPPVYYNNDWISFERKGLSKLIQGSAAGVTMKAISNVYRAGLKFMLCIHDEICISTKNNDDIGLLEQHMINTYKMQVPMVVEISKGKSWAD